MEVLKAVEENAETSNRESASALLRGHSSTMWTFLTPSPCGPTWFFGRSPKKPCVLFEYPSPVIAIFLWFYLKSSDFIYLVWEGTKHFCSRRPTTNTPLPLLDSRCLLETPSLSIWFVDATSHLLKVFPYYWLHMVCKKYFISGATSVKFLFYKEALGDRLNKVDFS